MRMKKLVNYYLLGKSLKEIEMDRILDRIHRKINISPKEKRFLDLYNHTTTYDRDLMLLSKNTTFSKISELLRMNKKVICDLHDRDGKIGMLITDIVNDIESSTCDVIMKNKKHKLHDRFLYNLIFNNKKSEYSLQEHDEYFEKIEIEK